MSTLKERLEEVMAAKDWRNRDIERVSQQSSSVVSQWLGNGSKIIKTIGKMEAAQRLADASGYTALWIATGQGPKLGGSALVVAETSPPYLLPAKVLQQLQVILRQIDPSLRDSFADLLAGWARSGGADDRAQGLLLLIEASERTGKNRQSPLT